MGFSIALASEDSPEVYSLSFCEKNKSLIIRVEKDAAVSFGSYFKSDNRINDIFIRDLQIPTFIPASEEKWGFGEVINTVEKSSKEIVWECKLPKRDGDSNAIRATLRQFFVYIDQFKEIKPSDHPQYFAITDILIEAGRDKSNFWVNISPAFCKWLAGCPDRWEEILFRVKESMEIALAHLRKELDWMDKARIKMYISPPKGFGLQVPGDACILSAGVPPNDNLEQGYVMGVHNADDRFQQLTLICGLARLWEIAKE